MAEATVVVQKAPPKGAYDFGEDETADVRIRILQQRYVRINNKVYTPERVWKLASDGKNRRVWDFETAEVDVPTRIADQLCKDGAEYKYGSGDEIETRVVRPIAVRVATKSVKPRRTKPKDKDQGDPDPEKTDET